MAALDYIQQASSGLPAAVSAADKVYKDDCMYSFDDAENNARGLDVCMSCFQAFARAGHKDYTAEHYERKRHALFVNITRLRKPPRAAGPAAEAGAAAETAARHKAPRLEIVEHNERDLYDETSSVYVAPLDVSVATSACPAGVAALARDILAADAASVAADIQAWQLQVFPCQHSLATTPASGPASPGSLAHCARCPLRENLWVCLDCGAVGCGREQFGSALKGNSHALSHYELTGHAVAVKLGSLSADDEDSCDCYCYLCNDEVKVPQLASKLRPFGVDLSSAVKSEKSLVELNVHTNQSWQFSVDGAAGAAMAPVFGPGRTGLRNLGNSCYLNSVLQALFCLPSYRAFFAPMRFDPAVPNAALHLPSQMLKMYDGLVSGRYSKPSAAADDMYQAGIRPSAFKALIGADHPEFQTNKQQDANEFLLYLFDRLDRHFGLSLNRDFKFLAGSKVVCSACRTGSRSSNLVDNISVPIPCKVLGSDAHGKHIYEEVSLADSFRAYAAQEHVENYTCENCGATDLTTKQEGFVSFPKNLVVSVQRITLVNWVPVKQEIPISVPDQIDVTEHKTPGFVEGETESQPKAQSPAANDFSPNQEVLTTLLCMGFSEPRCLRALYNTSNNDAEEAMNWVFAHMDDPDIDDPFDPDFPPPTNRAVDEAAPEAIDNLVSMGFGALLAKKALVLNQNNVNASIEWLFNNPDDDGVIEDDAKPVINLQDEVDKLTSELEKEPSTDKQGKYNLKAVICHKGTSPHTGHYVAFIKQDGDWILYNDEKVVRCGENIDEIKKNAYIYFFERQ
ncbi:ubiquitinyl hydrolase [Metschnikowia bicuspidata var. bicuspidata NRRL YB-4993]|uniref:Ubiquitin carboxyl-terminal hydrolase n=1 Tax=Metschnikowia bicuspidata var. bicuspidata NRRL YB-4993 TaxID=869754 RepID=A0A1A0HJG6_9ASCO|nr:ubiquitinyl hydrolase [Metschnikowia bicuspidata var. bicuspidata NRRL YB-4993]OBA24141.1 ubiquitinyl hydrolase [Metschnikowia bicuspidata var. bicuspidata NRRL YB-4993]